MITLTTVTFPLTALANNGIALAATLLFAGATLGCVVPQRNGYTYVFPCSCAAPGPTWLERSERSGKTDNTASNRKMTQAIDHIAPTSEWAQLPIARTHFRGHWIAVHRFEENTDGPL